MHTPPNPLQKAMDAHIARRGRLYLVDDDPHVLAALKFTFEADGYDVVTFTSGEALIKSPPQRHGDCIIIDHRLPGLTGLETLECLRAEGLATPVILMTTHPSRVLCKRASELRADIVEKPLTGDVLPRRVAALMNH